MSKIEFSLVVNHLVGDVETRRWAAVCGGDVVALVTEVTERRGNYGTITTSIQPTLHFLDLDEASQIVDFMKSLKDSD